jgi:glycine/D-amino acid oxidase-like deaminating enzyme
VPKPDVAVIGGGIVGTAAAASLAAAGARVVLHERDFLGAGASGRNSGVVQRPFDPVLGPLSHASLALYRELEASAVGGFRIGAEPNGLLLVALDDLAVIAAARAIAAAAPDLRPEIVDEAALQRLEPGLAPGLTACRVPIGYPVPPGLATRAYGELARSLGADIRESSPVAPVVVDGQAVGVRSIDARGRRDPIQAAGAVLVAAGPWAPALIDPTGEWRPIMPLWGVVVEIRLDAPPRHVLEEAEIEGVNDEGGHIADDQIAFSLVTAEGASSLGSTFLSDEPDPTALVGPIVVHGARFLPRIADATIRGVRMCARPLSSDGRPLVGRVPGIDRLWIAAGHGPWGISTGPATARLVADDILGRPVVLPAALDVARFAAPPSA